MPASDALPPRHDAAALRAFTIALFTAAGLEPDKAEAVGHYLVEADLIGHSTHGLSLAPSYLASIADGVLTRAGDPIVISDRGAAVAWDGRRLPGAWLTATAIDLAVERARLYGTGTVAIGASHHNGALAAYLHRATDHGMMVTVASSSPSAANVAPLGGRRGLYTPDPVAHGIPTPGDPILIDISASITTVNMTHRLIREKRRFDHDWLLDADGNPTNDPTVLENGGTLLPTGGLDHGQKGYGMALHIEALTQGLSGIGRVDNLPGTSASITVQVYDPAAFGGTDAFLRQTGWLVDACRANPPRPGVDAVRLPGDRAHAHKADALKNGVVLHPGIVTALAPHANRLGVAMPDAL